MELWNIGVMNNKCYYNQDNKINFKKFLTKNFLTHPSDYTLYRYTLYLYTFKPSTPQNSNKKFLSRNIL